MNNNIEPSTTWTAVDGTFSCGSALLTDVSVWDGECIGSFTFQEPIPLSAGDTITYKLTYTPENGTWVYAGDSTLQTITKKKKWNHEE